MSQSETTAERIKRKRQEHWPPISQARLARRLDIDSASLSKILSGQRKAPDGLYERIADIFGCPVTEIMSSHGVAA